MAKEIEIIEVKCWMVEGEKFDTADEAFNHQEKLHIENAAMHLVKKFKDRYVNIHISPIEKEYSDKLLRSLVKHMVEECFLKQDEESGTHDLYFPVDNIDKLEKL